MNIESDAALRAVETLTRIAEIPLPPKDLSVGRRPTPAHVTGILTAVATISLAAGVTLLWKSPGSETGIHETLQPKEVSIVNGGPPDPLTGEGEKMIDSEPIQERWITTSGAQSQPGLILEGAGSPIIVERLTVRGQTVVPRVLQVPGVDALVLVALPAHTGKTKGIPGLPGTVLFGVSLDLHHP